MSERWTPRRKAEVCARVRSGALSREQALLAFDLTEEELDLWLERAQAYGARGLRSTRTQFYRASGPEFRP